MTSPQDPKEPVNPDEVPNGGAQSAAEPELDPTLEADLAEALADLEGTDGTDGVAEADSDAAGAGEPSLEDQLAERTEDLQRLNAEYTNYRRRTERERVAVADAAKSKVIVQFLPVLDDLELARQHGDLAEGPLKAISDKLQGILDAQGLEAFGAEGDAFDPEIHEAVQDLSSGGEQMLGTVLRRGYRMGDKLVRTAMVIIADGAAGSADGAGAAEDDGTNGAAGSLEAAE
ncbi:nucleotide exchange factor GrpE [uncultured Corynebacterium sp.]|uniref:nucleotide exchange factor GrpE n=1 Tax=uncultured Corynebacterium sp. TaxID=159447 RepID=UPI0025D334FD|nr:nucleotide exchange factor GrpE [uncultured Corynebacterium sp.]